MEQPTHDAGTQGSAGNPSDQPTARRGLEHSSPDAGATPLLGPDGQSVSTTEDFTSGFGRMVGRNPVLASVASLTVGLIVGMIVGAAVARD